jgi:hypothetical protein
MVAGTNILVYKRCHSFVAHLYSTAKLVRRKRQDIYRLLLKSVDDVDGFYQLMKTGGFIVGDMASAFFTTTGVQSQSGIIRRRPRVLCKLVVLVLERRDYNFQCVEFSLPTDQSRD